MIVLLPDISIDPGNVIEANALMVTLTHQQNDTCRHHFWYWAVNIAVLHLKLEENRTHKSAKTHTDAVFVPRDLDLW